VVAVYSSQNETQDLAQPHYPATCIINHSLSQSRKTQGLKKVTKKKEKKKSHTEGAKRA
jgi:hypothetical protein